MTGSNSLLLGVVGTRCGSSFSGSYESASATRTRCCRAPLSRFASGARSRVAARLQRPDATAHDAAPSLVMKEGGSQSSVRDGDDYEIVSVASAKLLSWYSLGGLAEPASHRAPARSP